MLSVLHVIWFMVGQQAPNTHRCSLEIIKSSGISSGDPPIGLHLLQPLPPQSAHESSRKSLLFYLQGHSGKKDCPCQLWVTKVFLYGQDKWLVPVLSH